MHSMRGENSELNKQLDTSNIRMAQCDQEVAQASEQLVRLAKEIAMVKVGNILVHVDISEVLESLENKFGVITILVLLSVEK